MVYGYTVADKANKESFQNAADFVKNKFGYTAEGKVIEDVDGSLQQQLIKEGEKVTVISDEQIDYVAIKSTIPLPIICIAKWVTNE